MSQEFERNLDMSGVMEFLKSDEVKTDDKLKKAYDMPNIEEKKFYQVKEEIKTKPLETKKTFGRPGSATGLAYGAKKKNQTNDDLFGKVHDLEKENLGLKEKENLLEREITKMTTKLRRIQELIKAGKNFTDKDFASLQQDLEDQFNSIKEENDDLREKVRKLKVIQKGLSQKDYVSKKGGSKSKVFSQQSGYKSSIKHAPTVPSHIVGGHSSSYVQLTEELRNQLVKNEKEIIKLTAEQDKLMHSTTGNVYQDDIIRRIRDKDDEIRDIRRQMDDLEVNFVNKERIFKESKTYMDEMLKQLREQRVDSETLKQKNLRLHIQASSVKDLEEQSRVLEKE